MSLSFLDAAAECPDATALVTLKRSWSFAELAPRVAGEVALLQRLNLGRSGGPRYARVTAHVSVEFLARLYALIELGIGAVLLHPRWTATERSSVARTLPEAVGLDAVPAAEPARRLSAWRRREVPDQAPLAVVHTSGSGGRPKGVVLSRAAFAASAAASEARLGWREDDRWLLSLPPAHVGGLSIVTRCLLARKAVVLGAGLGAAGALALIADERVTLASVVAATLRRLLDASGGNRAPASLRAVLVGGGPCPTRLLGDAAARGWPVLATYGLTETCSQAVTQEPGSDPIGSGAGRPLPGIEVRIEDGEILLRGPVLMSGYLPAGAHADPLTPDGWLRTGDLGSLDEEGRLHVLGRRDDVIVTGGENVSPLEVEDALAAFPGVREALVFAVPDESWGALVAAALVVERTRPLADVELLAHLATRLAPFKRPRRIAVVGELPLGPNGKPDRRGAAEELAAVLRPFPARAGGTEGGVSDGG